MEPALSPFPEALLRRLGQVLYRCLEELGSTKAALYVRPPGRPDFCLSAHYGWPRTDPPPAALPPESPLLVLVQRERRGFSANDPGPFPELAALAAGSATPRFQVNPIYHRGDWVALLIQRDPQGGGRFDPERMESPTQAICQEVAQALEELPGPSVLTPLPPGGAPAAPREAAPPQASPPPSQAKGPAGPPAILPAPDQLSFFWEAASLLGQAVGASAVAFHRPGRDFPVLAHSLRPLSPELQRQLADQTLAQVPPPPAAPPDGAGAPRLRLLTRAEDPGQAPLQGTFLASLALLAGKEDRLMIFRLEAAPFTGADREVAQRVGRMLGLHLEEADLRERYSQAFLSVGRRILATADGRNPAIHPHSLQTSQLCRELARRLGLPSPEVEAVSLAAILHDVGTLFLDPRMFRKTTLTPSDWEQVRRHPLLAPALLKDLEFPFDILKLIRHHHERWDGQGYPDGLGGETIPLGSRIINLVESFQVMTSGTDYKPPISREAALEELRKGSGGQFDPAMVGEFMQMMEAVHLSFG